MNTEKERREYPRLPARDNTLAVNTRHFGRVINMSMGGLRIKYLLRGNDTFQNSLEISLLNKDGDQFIEKLPCVVASCIDSRPFCQPMNLFTREVGVTFTDLTSSQKKLLANFICHTTLTNATLDKCPPQPLPKDSCPTS